MIYVFISFVYILDPYVYEQLQYWLYVYNQMYIPGVPELSIGTGNRSTPSELEIGPLHRNWKSAQNPPVEIGPQHFKECQSRP
jgi:hypothetical protein